MTAVNTRQVTEPVHGAVLVMENLYQVPAA